MAKKDRSAGTPEGGPSADRADAATAKRVRAIVKVDRSLEAARKEVARRTNQLARATAVVAELQARRAGLDGEVAARPAPAASPKVAARAKAAPAPKATPRTKAAPRAKATPIPKAAPGPRAAPASPAAATGSAASTARPKSTVRPKRKAATSSPKATPRPRRRRSPRSTGPAGGSADG